MEETKGKKEINQEKKPKKLTKEKPSSNTYIQQNQSLPEVEMSVITSGANFIKQQVIIRGRGYDEISAARLFNHSLSYLTQTLRIINDPSNKKQIKKE